MASSGQLNTQTLLSSTLRSASSRVQRSSVEYVCLAAQIYSDWLIKYQVLAVDAERKRIELTAKKTLVESELPIVTGFDGLETGTITHAFVSRVLDKSLIVEFYNHIRAIVPARETRFGHQVA